MDNINPVTQFIIDYLIKRDKVGLKKYGKSVADGDPPSGQWQLEVIEELLDALQYSTRLNFELQKDKDALYEEICRLENEISLLVDSALC